ncbi:MAG: hypothetical protein IT438_02190 [Phycisphaerales bacterium]|nr:hypothetical protein [Phycisphaerales bacterium]
MILIRANARVLCFFVALLGLVAATGAQQPTTGGGSVAAAVPDGVNVGIEGKLIYRSARELRARPFNNKSPVVIRIASSAADGSAILYDLRYIGVRPGRYDLRDALERADGGSLADEPEAIIEVVGILPEDHGGELVGSPGLGLPRLGPYRLGLIVLGAIWMFPLAVVIFRRLTRRRKVAATATVIAPLTLADQLRPLVEAAIEGLAGVEDLARLERLLIAHWRDRLGLAQRSTVEALHELRRHPIGGEILRGVEAWLHGPRNSTERAPDVAAMLEPYRRVGVVRLDSAETALPASDVKAPPSVPVGGAA